MHPLPQPLSIYIGSALTNIETKLKKRSAKWRAIARRIFREFRFKDKQYFFEVYDPAEHTSPGSNHTPEEVYITDHLHAMSADLVFLLVNAPSHGAGMEVQIAADATVPKVVAFSKDEQVSRMVDGIFSPTLAKIEFESDSHFAKLLESALPRIAQQVVDSHQRRTPVVARIAQACFGRQIMCHRISRGVSRANLAERTDIRENWLRELERDDKNALTMTLAQLGRILSVLECTLLMGEKSDPTIWGNGDLSYQQLPDSAKSSSLDNLAKFACDKGDWTEDLNILRLWRDFAEEVNIGVEGRTPIKQVKTVEDWERLYGELALF